MLCKKALTQIVAAEPPSQKHFTLKRKSKSQVQRSELVQKSSDLQNSEAKLNRSSSGSNGALSIPVRSKTAPSRLKLGQMKNMSMSSGMSPMSSFGPHQKMTSENSANRFKDNKRGGAKLIEITDQPLGGAAGRMKKHKSNIVVTNPVSKPDQSTEENRTIDESVESTQPREEAQSSVAVEVDMNRQMSSGSELDESKSRSMHMNKNSDSVVSKKEAENEMPEYAVGLQSYPLKTEVSRVLTRIS